MSETITQTVQSKYASVAKSRLSNQDKGVRAIAEAFGYSADQLVSVPADANMGLSCGNPTAFASLKPGEVVVDLGDTSCKTPVATAYIEKVEALGRVGLKRKTMKC